MCLVAGMFAPGVRANAGEDAVVPTRIDGLGGVVAVAAGGAHSLALVSDGTVWAWGSDERGQLGNDAQLSNSPVPVRVAGLSGVTAIAAGGAHSLALRSDGTVWAWGSDEHGQLGNDVQLVDSPVPVRVAGLSGVTAIAAGDAHSLAVHGSGGTFAFGANDRGQLGDGTTADRPTPVSVAALAGIAEVAAGGAHSLARRAEGALWAWGANDRGQLGDGTTSDRPLRVAVQAAFVSRIAAGGQHSMATSLDDGALLAWGANDQGQVGDGSRVDRLLPTPVVGLVGVLDIDAGGAHSLAVRFDGLAFAFGDNARGQLGDGTTEDRDVPTAVQLLRDAVVVAAGGAHSLAVTAGGDAWAWGANDGGQVTGIQLEARGYRVRGLQKADLAWVGATGDAVEVYRDGVLVATTENDGTYTDDIDERQCGAAYVYQVCQAGTSTCSNEALVEFG